MTDPQLADAREVNLVHQFSVNEEKAREWPGRIVSAYPDEATQEVIRHLADMAHSLDACLREVRSQHNVPDPAKPELDAVADLLMNAGRRLSALAKAPGQEPGSADPAQQAGQSFPQAPLADRADGGERLAARPAGPDSAVKPPKP